MSIQLITFDLDNTLWDVDTVIVKAESKMRDWMKTNVPESLKYYSQEFLPDLRQRVVSENPRKRFDLTFMRLEILFKVMQLCGQPDDMAKVNAHQAFDIFFEARNEVNFFSGAISVLEALQDKYIIYALTNGNADIEKTGLKKYMQGAISAADVSASKPDPKMFEKVSQITEVSPQNSVHIGDNLVDDIEGAANANFLSIWVNLKTQSLKTGDATPSRIVEHLSEIPAAISSLEHPI